MNTYEQLRRAVAAGLISKQQAVAISYAPRPEGRMGICHINKSVVWSPFFKTDPNAHWMDYGNKSFSGNRAGSFPKAKEWASKTYGIASWKPNRMRDHVPAQVQDAFPIPKDREASDPSSGAGSVIGGNEKV